MIADNIQKQKFEERLKRVAAGGPNTMSQLYAGTVVSERTRGKSKARARAARDTAAKPRRTGASVPVSLISGLLIGAGSVMLARYLRFRLTGGGITGPDADILMATDVVVAITIAIILRAMFRFKSRLHGAAKLIGVVAMVMLMHNLVYFAPGLFERAYSVQWVDDVVTTTQPKTALLGSASFNLVANGTTANDL